MAHTPSIPGRQCYPSHRCRPHIGLRGSIYGARCGSTTFASKTVGLQERGGAFQQTRSSHSNSCLRCQSEHAAEGQVTEGAFQAAPGGDVIQQHSHIDPQSAQQAASVYQPASLSRVFIGVQPGRGLARQITKVGKPSGPMSLMLLLFTLAGTISAAVRQRFEAAARECTTCHGFGINRCTLCNGSGAVGWEGKWDHKEPCPMCLGKRFVDCPECGGHFHRRIFNHHHHTGLTVTELVEVEQTPVSKLGD